MTHASDALISNYMVAVSQPETVSDYAIHAVDHEGLVINWTSGLKSLTGYLAEDVVGRPISLLHLDEPPIANMPSPSFRSLVRDGHFKNQGWYQRKDGSRFWAEFLILPFEAEVKSPQGYLVVIRDLSEERVRENALFEAENNLTLALRLMPHGIVFYNSDDKLVLVNDMYAEMFGVAKDVARPGMSFWDVLLGTITARKTERDPADIAKRFYEKHHTSALVENRFQQLIQYSPQKFISVETEIFPDGSWVSVFKELTEKMRMEAALYDSEKSYRDVFNNSSDCISVIEVASEGKFKLERLNPAYERLVLLDTDQVRGELIENVFQGTRAEALTAQYRSCASKGLRIEYEESLATRIGQRDFETNLIPVHGTDGAIRHIISIARDVTEDRQLFTLRAERENYFRTLVENSPDVIVRYDRNCRRIYSNSAHSKVSGISSSEGFGKTPVEVGVFSPSLAKEFQARIEGVIATGEVDEINVNFEKNSNGIHYSIRAVPELNADGSIVSVLTMARDMTDRVNAETQLKQREQEYRTLVENSPDFISRFDQNGKCIYMNQAMRKKLDRSIEPLGSYPAGFLVLVKALAFEANIRAAFHHRAMQEAEVEYVTYRNESQWGQVRFAPEFDDDGVVLSVLAVSHDITELVQSRDKVNHLAFHDALTDLPNRTFLHNYIDELISESDGSGVQFGFMMLDVDRFKEVNDTLGHAAGDMLLQKVAQRLRNVVRAGDVVARLGGDEFAIVLPKLSSKKRLAGVAARISRHLSKPIHLSGREIAISASIGIARFPLDTDDFSTILKDADAAMYKAKGMGRNGYQFYDSEMMARATERMILEATLRKALAKNELELYFQPQVTLSSSEMTGAEALLRWHHPEFGFLTPDRFISLAEETGLIVEIGRWVIEQTCEVAARLNSGRREPFTLSANVSPRQFAHNELISTVITALTSASCKPEWLCLEITEGLLLEDKQDVKSTLQSLKEVGVSIAIDDFGTGFSALSYLSNFPIDVLKIDRSFVRDIGIDPRKTELVRAIIGIANALDMKLVAEGIETPLQADVLEVNGCGVAQGYLFGRPMNEQQLTQLLSLPNAIRSHA